MDESSIQDHFFSPRNIGELAESGFEGRATSLSCGAVVKISIQVDDQSIREIKFKAVGCSILIAAASALTEMVKGKRTAESAILARQLVLQFSSALNKDVRDRLPCAQMASDALLRAISRFSDEVRQEWEGDDALVCTCFCVSESTIEHVIQRQGLRTIREVTQACRAGAGCRSCWPLIEDMIRTLKAPI